MNPFKLGKEVSGYQFYDRRKSCDDLHRKMVDGSTNVVLFAPRRYGKTSLVLKVLKRLRDEDGMLGMLFDMNKVPTLEQRDGRYRIEDPMLIRYLLSSPAITFS